MLDHNIELVHTNTKVSIEHFTFGSEYYNSQEAEGDEKAEVVVSFSSNRPFLSSAKI